MHGEDEIAREVRSAAAEGDWSRLRLLLHPYLHWQLPDGSTVRGRTKALALLAEHGVSDAPARVELRDGQVYRWLVDRTGAGGA